MAGAAPPPAPPRCALFLGCPPDEPAYADALAWLQAIARTAGAGTTLAWLTSYYGVRNELRRIAASPGVAVLPAVLGGLAGGCAVLVSRVITAGGEAGLLFYGPFTARGLILRPATLASLTVQDDVVVAPDDAPSDVRAAAWMLTALRRTRFDHVVLVPIVTGGALAPLASRLRALTGATVHWNDAPLTFAMGAPSVQTSGAVAQGVAWFTDVAVALQAAAGAFLPGTQRREPSP